MKTWLRLWCVCFVGVGFASAASGQDAALLECTAIYPRPGMQVYRLSVSAGADPTFGPAPFLHLECAEVLATFLSEGYEIALTYTEDNALPTYTLIRTQRVQPNARGSTEELFYLGCWYAMSDFRHIVFYTSTSPNAPAFPVGQTSSCVDALAELMRAGFSLVHAGAGSSRLFQYMFHRGRRPPFVDARTFPSSSGAPVARLDCNFNWDGDFVVRFGESSPGGPAVAFGEDVDCSVEVSRFLNLGFRILDARIGQFAESHVTLVHDPGIVPTPPSKPTGRDHLRPKDVAIVMCSEASIGSGVDEWVVRVASSSSRLARIAPFELCQPVLESRLSTGFELREVSGSVSGRILVFTLVSSETHGRGRKRGF
jgi:hypothetical protein